MNCSRCNNINRVNSKFCRFCGGPLLGERQYIRKSHLEPVITDGKRPTKSKTVKILYTSLLISLISGGSVYAAPKVNDFIKVDGSIKSAKLKSNSGDYQGALDSLIQVRSRWSTSSQKEELVKLEGNQKKYLEYKKSFDDSVEKEEAGLLTDARILLQSINSEYPKYEDVRNKLSEIQSKIESGLQAKAKEASNAKLEADRRAQAESAERARAQADAQAASQAKARAESLAASAAQAAREAEAQRQQEVIKRVEEIKRSFRSELTAGYNSYSQGINYYNSAIQYSNVSNSLLAISQAGSARAVLNTARSTVSDLNYRFTGLSNDYYTAANDMITAIDGLSKATDLLINSEGTSLDYSSAINSYKDVAANYAARVKSFLSANSY